MTMENIAKNQGQLGKLKTVSRCRDPFVCHYCKNDIEGGSPCFDQSDYTVPGFFPAKIRMCIECGEKMKKGGIEVKEKKTKAKKEKVEKKEVVIDPKDGCGKDTEYPKPDKSGVWKCGEKAPVVGIMRCNKCGGMNNE